MLKDYCVVTLVICLNFGVRNYFEHQVVVRVNELGLITWC